MELLLIRHAMACERDPRRWKDDSQRPLSAQGVRSYRRAAKGLRRIIEPPTLMLSSPLVRARQTAGILSDVAGWPVAKLTATLAPGHPAEQTIVSLSKLRVLRLAIVGHEPDLGRFLTYCIPGGAAQTFVEFKKGAVACVAFAGKPRAGEGSLRWLLPPRVLRTLAE